MCLKAKELFPSPKGGVKLSEFESFVKLFVCLEVSSSELCLKFTTFKCFKIIFLMFVLQQYWLLKWRLSKPGPSFKKQNFDLWMRKSVCKRGHVEERGAALCKVLQKHCWAAGRDCENFKQAQLQLEGWRRGREHRHTASSLCLLTSTPELIYRIFRQVEDFSFE